MFFDDFEELFNAFDIMPTVVKYNQSAAKKCPVCGHSLADFERSGKLGCGECYNTFRSWIEPTLRRIHSSSAHTGKIPSKSEGTLKRERLYADLKKQLSEAVAKEDYESAAKLHKQIKEMESDMQ